MPLELTAADVARMRAVNQLLPAGPARTIAATASWMLAVQAQDYTASKWVIGSRTHGSVRDRDIEVALERREIVRSWPLRGTLHITAAADLGWMLELAAARPLRSAKTRQESLGLPLPTLERSAELTHEILADGRILARDAFLTELADQGIDGSGQRGAHLIGYLAQTFVICLGPRVGKQHGIVLAESWLPPTPRLSREEALHRLALGYVRGHGPVDAADLAWWAMLLKSEATAAMASIQEELEEFDYDGRTVAVLKDSPALVPEMITEGRRSMTALGAFDELILGYRDRQPNLSDEHFELVVPGKNGMFLRTLQHGGRIRGTWRTDPKSASGAAVVPFDTLTADERTGFERALAEHARFVSAQ
ncbi:winged helix DNA-binding domain-containing protein [Naasia lichenicola]|nr:winged helix DNA-binding domain-containing protein [Naasia lichenicola]